MLCTLNVHVAIPAYHAKYMDQAMDGTRQGEVGPIGNYAIESLRGAQQDVMGGINDCVCRRGGGGGGGVVYMVLPAHGIV